MKRGIAVFAALLAAAGCGETSYNLATGKQETLLMSTQKEVDMGRRIAERVIEEIPPVDDQFEQDRIRELGRRLAAVAERKDIDFEFTVLEGEEVNAFSLPGGFIFMFEGLIEKAESDEAVAGVLAHEIAHVTARHAAKRYRSQLGMQILQLATLAAQQPEAAAGATVAMQAAMLAYSRDEEVEADRLAVRYMQKAGMDPEAFLGFLDTMQEEGAKHQGYLPRGVIAPHYGRTHPFVPERRVAVKEEIYGVADYIDYLNIQR